MQRNHTPKPSGTQIRVGGRVVGEVRGDTFFKRIHDNHFLQKPRGIAADVQTLRDAQSAGAEYFCAHHVEGKRDYIAPIRRFCERGIPVNRGFGSQLALILEDFNKDDDAPTPTTPRPTQPALFNLSHLE